MKQVVVLSGKGGTGKTTVMAALAHLASQEMAVVLADADVDAANLELVLDPVGVEEHAFMSGLTAVIDPQTCTGCGTCAEVCRFEAVAPAGEEGVGSYVIDPLACEGCGACYTQCVEEAIRLEEQQAGTWSRSRTRFGPLFHAHLFAGQENSGKLVTQVRQQARLVAREMGADLVLVDGPPGIGCPVISASGGMDLAVHVVEPTVSGVHDLARVMATTDHFRVPSAVVVNKMDLNRKRAAEIVDFCTSRGIEVLGDVPYDPVVIEAMVAGVPVTAYADGMVKGALQAVWQRMRRLLNI